jgi:hypothetical protein
MWRIGFNIIVTFHSLTCYFFLGTDGTEDDDEELVKSPTDLSREAASSISASDDVSLPLCC